MIFIISPASCPETILTDDLSIILARWALTYCTP